MIRMSVEVNRSKDDGSISGLMPLAFQMVMLTVFNCGLVIVVVLYRRWDLRPLILVN